MARPAPRDDGNLARVIAAMVGIVGILVLGSLAWSAVGAMLSSLGQATSALSSSRPAPAPAPAQTPSTVAGGAGSSVGTPSAQLAAAPTAAPAVSTGTPIAQAPVPAAPPTAASAPPPAQPTPTPSPAATSRAPWILLPLPAPGTRVPAGSVVVEARGRGDASISAIHLELDGAALPASFEQRSESTWRAAATTSVVPGHHAVRATVQDDQGRTGSFRWTFDAGS